ncbi:MAG: transcriptional regulator [Euryarchaeota archaeon]|nr:transcriptional regulator [Euryarchaeota archaeon]
MVELDPVLHQPTRLRIMSFLMRSRVTAVTRLRDALGLTDGNLAGHLGRLETAGYVSVGRTLTALRFESKVAITPTGSVAFAEYLRGLRALLFDLEAGADP